MSSKSSKKTTTTGIKAPEPIITRTKSAQQRQQLKNKAMKTEKPKLTKPEIKSPKLNKTVVCSKESQIKNPVKSSADIIEQVEYYPNKLKRDICTKKIMLKPKHNFKVIAATNKRKLATPQKGLKSPPSKQCSQIKSAKRSKITTKARSSPELSMQDMVRIMDETRSLSDEDFMEILTCPSPVWWEDPPDGVFDEDSIHTRPPEPPLKKITKETKKRKITSKLPSNKSNKSIININHSTEQSKVTENKKDEKFVKKKLKLENILGNIKNKKPKDEVKSNEIDSSRKCSESEGDISDLSFNEEEILKNLENMEIPIEQSVTEPKHPLNIKKEMDEIEIKKEAIEIYENEIVSKNHNVDRENLLLIKKKPEIKDEFSIKSSVFDKDSILDSSTQFKSDGNLEGMSSNTDEKCDEIVDSCTNSSLDNNKASNSLLDLYNSSNCGTANKSAQENTTYYYIKNADDSNAVNNDIFPTKKTNDLSEFITVYKIIPEKVNIESPENDTKSVENTKKTKLDTVRGKLNDFFKQCKSNKHFKKTENPTPAIPLTDIKEEPTDDEKENGDNKIDLEDEKNRLKSCNYCLEKTENGTANFSCEKCEMAPILPCNLCNFLAETKEVYRNHVSTCKDVARISWKHNYVLNQT